MVKIGDRIRLIAINIGFRGHVPDEFVKLYPDAEGIIVDIEAAVGRIWVEWDDGSKSALLNGVDNFEVIRSQH